MSLSILALAFLLWTSIAMAPAFATTCDSAAEAAARRHEIPIRLLKALARVETGRTIKGHFQPWPWAVNLEGRGSWFPSRAAAFAFLHAAQSQGQRNFDVGCFQINNLWHGAAFGGIDDMLDPSQNADYAARFLKSLYEETGSWDTAIGHFHSRTPEKAAQYKTRFDLVYAKLPADIDMVQQSQRLTFFDSGGSVTGGSLVPLSSRGMRFFTSAQPLFGSQ